MLDGNDMDWLDAGLEGDNTEGGSNMHARMMISMISTER